MRHNVLIIDEILLSNVFAETDKDYLSLLSANDVRVPLWMSIASLTDALEARNPCSERSRYW